MTEESIGDGRLPMPCGSNVGEVTSSDDLARQFEEALLNCDSSDDEEFHDAETEVPGHVGEVRDGTENVDMTKCTVESVVDETSLPEHCVLEAGKEHPDDLENAEHTASIHDQLPMFNNSASATYSNQSDESKSVSKSRCCDLENETDIINKHEPQTSDPTSEPDINVNEIVEEVIEEGAKMEDDSEGQTVFVDEEQILRDLEATWSEEEKEGKKAEAQELKTSGNELFKKECIEEARDQYTAALALCPTSFPKERSIMYSNRAACRMRLGENEDAIKDCTKAMELNPRYLKCVLRRAELHEKTEKLDEALVDYQKVLELDPSIHTARAACMRLPDQIKERNEKLKEEMMGKLKDLGNMILKPFGLSTDSFQIQQDPNSGGYSVNFKR